MWKYLGAIVKGILFLLGLVGLVTLPEDVQKWAELMGPLADYVSIDRVEFALYAAIIVFGLWILLPAATPFLAEVRRFFKQHDRRRFDTKPSHEPDQQPEEKPEPLWATLVEKNPADALIILSAGIERSRLQGDHPAWEIFFAAYNGGVGEVRLISADGSFKIRGQAYPTPVELKSATPAKHGEITLFTVRQWIDQRDVPQEQQGQNHVVLQLSDLKIEAIARDPVSGNERPFIVPLPDHLQFDVRHHWRVHPEMFARFYRERLGTDDNKAAKTAATARHEVRLSDAFYWIINNSAWGLGLGTDSFLEQAANALRQAAKDGEITVRGRRELPGYEPDGQFDDTWNDIEQGYWQTHKFEMTAVMGAGPHYATRETVAVSSSDANTEAMPHHAMLRVWNDKLEKRWPPVNTSA